MTTSPSLSMPSSTPRVTSCSTMLRERQFGSPTARAISFRVNSPDCPRSLPSSAALTFWYSASRCNQCRDRVGVFRLFLLPAHNFPLPIQSNFDPRQVAVAFLGADHVDLLVVQVRRFVHPIKTNLDHIVYIRPGRHDIASPRACLERFRPRLRDAINRNDIDLDIDLNRLADHLPRSRRDQPLILQTLMPE